MTVDTGAGLNLAFRLLRLTAPTLQTNLPSLTHVRPRLLLINQSSISDGPNAMLTFSAHQSMLSHQTMQLVRGRAQSSWSVRKHAGCGRRSGLRSRAAAARRLGGHPAGRDLHLLHAADQPRGRRTHECRRARRAADGAPAAGAARRRRQAGMRLTNIAEDILCNPCMQVVLPLRRLTADSFCCPLQIARLGAGDSYDTLLRHDVKEPHDHVLTCRCVLLCRASSCLLARTCRHRKRGYGFRRPCLNIPTCSKQAGLRLGHGMSNRQCMARTAKTTIQHMCHCHAAARHTLPQTAPRAASSRQWCLSPATRCRSVQRCGFD